MWKPSFVYFMQNPNGKYSLWIDDVRVIRNSRGQIAHNLAKCLARNYDLPLVRGRLKLEPQNLA